MRRLKEETLGDIRLEYEDVQEHGYLWLRVLGRYSPGFTLGAMGKCVAELRELGYKKCLVDFRLAQHKMSTLETYWRTQYAEEMNIPKYIRGAFVFTELTEELRFGETVFFNRGWNFHVFDAIDAALDWLLDD